MDFDPLTLFRTRWRPPSAWHQPSSDQPRGGKKRRPIHEAALEPADDGVIIRLNVECLDEAARYLIPTRLPISVRQPEELRGVLRLATEIARAAEPAVGVS